MTTQEVTASGRLFGGFKSTLRNWWWKVAAIGVVAAGCVWMINRLAGFDELAASSQVSIEESWNRTINSLGVSPIFPPEEDLVVGDVLAVVTGDEDSDPAAQAENVTKKAFVSRSVKLAHVNVGRQLDEAYSTLPVFPATIPADLKPPFRKTVVAREFSDAVALNSLPRAAFPRLKIQGIDNAAGGLSVGQRGSGSYAAGAQKLEEFELSDVRTYGLPSVKALKLLNEYCEHGETKEVCTESTARHHLERVVGPRIHTQYLSRKSGKLQHAISIEIVMVYRVYLTSSIVDLRRSVRNQSGGLSALWLFGQKDAASSPETTPPSSGDDQLKTIDSRVRQLERQVSSIQNGPALRYESYFGNESSLQARFERPVAIGYRSVKVNIADQN